MLACELDRALKLALSDFSPEKALSAAAIVGSEQRAESRFGVFVTVFFQIQLGELRAGIIRCWINFQQRSQILARLLRFGHLDEGVRANQPGCLIRWIFAQDLRCCLHRVR